jgi:hypothetical protein
MISEYIQLLSTAHRLLDVPTVTMYSAPGKKSKPYRLLPGESLDIKDVLVSQEYLATNLNTEYVSSYESKVYIKNQQAAALTHANHPSALWTRQSKANYDWLWSLTVALNEEYKFRYSGKDHKLFENYQHFLKNSPKNIPDTLFTEPTPAMPDKYKVENDSALSYKKYYVGSKYRFAKWKSRQIPSWFFDLIESVWEDDEKQDRLNFFSQPKNLTKSSLSDYVLNGI